MTGGLMQPLRLWPLWAVALGLWYPLYFLSVLDGYHHFLRLSQFPFVYAAGWAMHALPLLLVFGGIAIGQRVVVRSPTLVGWLQWLVTAGARALAGIVLVYASLEWARSVFPELGPSLRFPWRWIALACTGLALALTWSRPQAGPLLQLSRRVAIVTAVAVGILLPVEAFMTWRDWRPAPRIASLTAGDKPDVVLITIDTLAANHMSLYGYERATTPRIDAFAKDATVFDRFYANSNFTSPSSASFLYGVRSWTHRAWNVGSAPVNADGAPNVLRTFHEAGYRVISVDTNPCAAPMQNRLMPWVDDIASLQIRTSFLWSYWPNRWLPSFDQAFVSKPVHVLERYLDKVLLRLGVFEHNGHFAPEVPLARARELWTKDTSRPRLLWVHLFGPHDPYATPAAFLGRFDSSDARRTRFNSTPAYQWGASRDKSFPGSLVGRYDEGILYSDHHVGEFLDWLRQQGDFDDSVIVLSSDHGESFSRGYGGHGGPLLTEEVIRIPLIVKPAGVAAGARSQVVVEQVDLPQILLQQAGLPLLEGVEGRAVALDAAPDDDPAFALNFERNRRFDELRTGSIAMVQGQWKYVHYLNLLKYVSMPEMGDELYDLAADPREQVNLATRQPERAMQMKAAVLQELQKHAQAVR